MAKTKEIENEKEIKRISLALFQITNMISKLEIPESEKKTIVKKIKEQDKKILKLHDVKFSEKDKQNLLEFLE